MNPCVIAPMRARERARARDAEPGLFGRGAGSFTFTVTSV